MCTPPPLEGLLAKWSGSHLVASEEGTRDISSPVPNVTSFIQNELPGTLFLKLAFVALTVYTFLEGMGKGPIIRVVGRAGLQAPAKFFRQMTSSLGL